MAEHDIKIGKQINLEISLSKKTGRSSRDERNPLVKPRIYIWPQGETILEQLATRHHRPHQVWLHTIIPMVLAAVGLPLDTPVKWDQRAGCTCPCSPGFILTDSRSFPYDIGVTIKESTVTEWLTEDGQKVAPKGNLPVVLPDTQPTETTHQAVEGNDGNEGNAESTPAAPVAGQPEGR